MSGLISEVFAEFCESYAHLDALLAQLPANQKSKVARVLGTFLRRPLTHANHFKIEVAESPEAFWSLGFLKLKKSKPVHALLQAMWEQKILLSDGGVVDFPPSMIKRFQNEWGNALTEPMARLLSQDPLTTIRFHRRAFQENGELIPELQSWLKSDELPKSRVGRVSPVARIFKGFARVQQNEFFKRGFFEIQDEGSQAMSRYAIDPESILPFLSETPQTQKVLGEGVSWRKHAAPLTLIDACSGSGGKTLALADFLDGRGRIYAYDIYQGKVRSLRERMERAGEHNVQALHLPGGDVESLEKFKSSADVVLIDAPCSGLGVLRRNPDIKWNRKPSSVKDAESEISIEDLQRNVMEAYSPLVKPGGKLVFGVCTFSKSESTGQVANFLSNHANFKLESGGFLGPYDTDGFYMASLRRVE